MDSAVMADPELRDSLVSHLVEALGQADVSSFTLRQLREYAGVAVSAALEKTVTGSSASSSTAEQSSETSARDVQTRPGFQSSFDANGSATRAEGAVAASIETASPSTARRTKVPLGPVLLIAIVIALGYAFVRSLTASGAGLPAPPQPPAGRIEGPKLQTYSVDGIVFQPQKTFRGDQSGQPYEMEFGRVSAIAGRLIIQVGGIPGLDGAFDDLRLRSSGGKDLRFEAEDSSITRGDASTLEDNPTDGHWWLQEYGSFSGGKGLIIRKTEKVPQLTMALSVPEDEYDAYVGSFKGDGGGGPFGLGISVK